MQIISVKMVLRFVFDKCKTSLYNMKNKYQDILSKYVLTM